MPLIAGDIYSFNRYYGARPESGSGTLPNCQAVVMRAVRASLAFGAEEMVVVFR